MIVQVFFSLKLLKDNHFKSIDKLFAQEKKKSFIYNETPDREMGIPAGYDGKILDKVLIILLMHKQSLVLVHIILS